jgi:hypothetical protein
MVMHPLRTFVAAFLLVFGALIFTAGLQLGGVFILFGVPGLLLIFAVIYDTLLKTPMKILRSRRIKT